jgi:protease IV
MKKISFGLGLILLGLARAAWSQSALERPTRLPALGRSLVSNGDSTAMAQNPANIAFLPGPEFRWTGYFLNGEAQSSQQGHAFGFALPIPFLHLATGLRLDLVSPSSSVASQMSRTGLSYQWLTWNVAMGSEVAAIGFSFEHSYSNQSDFHDFGTWSVGTTLRPFDYLGIAGVVQQVDAPTSTAGNRLGTSYQFGLSARPLGTGLIEASLEGNYVDENGGYWMPRAVLDVGIPELGRLRGDVTWVDPEGKLGTPAWVASTALVINVNARKGSGELSLGARYGDALGPDAGERFYENLYGEMAIRGFREAYAADNLGYAVRVRLEETPKGRSHTAWLRSLWAFSEEKNLRTVLLELRASPADSLAHLEEVVDAILLLRQKGKKVLCHLEDGSGASLYACSQADQLLINPAGGIRYGGLKSDSFYLAGLLRKVGVSADFVRIGAHKSAPEMFTNEQGSPTTASDRAELLQEAEREISSTIARGRKQSVEQIRKATTKGPFTSLEAKELGLVDGFAFDDMLPEKVNNLSGESLHIEKGGLAHTRSDRFAPDKQIAVVYVEGDMVDGRSHVYPFIGLRTAGSYTIAESLKKVREDKGVGAVVLRVETGGGSAMASDVIWREVQLTAAKKPVVVSMGSAAASGGYYISSAGSYLYANPLTITGSIGIFFGKVELSNLLRNVGVNIETFRTTPTADIDSLFRPYTPEERHVLEQKIQQFYNLFLRRVSDGRHMTKEAVDAVGQGRVWTGRQAKSHGLVDDLGGLRQALAKARVLADLRDDAPIVELPVLPQTLISRVLGIEGLKQMQASDPFPVPQELRKALEQVAPYALYAGDEPLARIETLPELTP